MLALKRLPEKHTLIKLAAQTNNYKHSKEYRNCKLQSTAFHCASN